MCAFTTVLHHVIHGGRLTEKKMWEDRVDMRGVGGEGNSCASEKSLFVISAGVLFPLQRRAKQKPWCVMMWGLEHSVLLWHRMSASLLELKCTFWVAYSTSYLSSSKKVAAALEDLASEDLDLALVLCSDKLHKLELWLSMNRKNFSSAYHQA